MLTNGNGVTYMKQANDGNLTGADNIANAKADLENGGQDIIIRLQVKIIVDMIGRIIL